MYHCCNSWIILTYLGIHEDEVHLQERERNLESRVQPVDEVVARRRRRDFEERPELQAAVDQRSEPEHFNIERK